VSPDPLLACAGLSKTYVTPSGGIEALHEVDAAFTVGEITAVVGPSGSGKSTLLRALAGLDRPSGGSLRAGGEELSHASPAGLRHHRRETVTFVNQKASDNFVPHLTVREHAEDAPAAVEPLLADFGLSHRFASKPAELSGGEQARAAFALALARATPAIVADEPTAELDRDSAGHLLAAIRRHAGEGTAFVIATHDPDVIGIADRVLYLDRGRVVAGAEHATARERRALPDDAAQVVASAAGVSKSFRRRSEVIEALRDVTLELRGAEVSVVLGRSGSGKSTLLMLLAGWQAPDAGRIRYEPDGAAASDLPWRRLAFLPQRFGLLPELSVRENVEYPARLAGELAERSDAIEGLLAALGLDELADRPPQETSIGQQQRTALARALALSPDVLLADEPTSHQDAGWRDRVWELLEDAAARGTASLIATHEEAARDHAARVWEIDKGTVAVAG
jgi:putative ABC transport system ATP-binding protein